MADMGGDWGWAKITPPDMQEVREKLAQFELKTWAQLSSESKNQHHQVDKAGISADAQKRLRVIKRDEYDELCSLRLSGQKRVWGILVENIVYLLWWDPTHTVWPVKKKHT